MFFRTGYQNKAMEKHFKEKPPSKQTLTNKGLDQSLRESSKEQENVSKTDPAVKSGKGSSQSEVIETKTKESVAEDCERKLEQNVNVLNEELDLLSVEGIKQKKTIIGLD